MSDVIHHPNHFTSLPREYYVSAELFEAEGREIFQNQWQYVGHTSQIPNPGDYIVTSFWRESLIITRTRRDAVKAYFNVCRHRGSQICTPDSTGTARGFSCPYHQWSWNLDGELRGAPAASDIPDFDKTRWSLHEAAVEVVHGSIYIHLGTPERSAREQLTGIDDETMALIEPERMKLIHEERYRVQANWKLMMENNLECYHCAGAHPALFTVADVPIGFGEIDADGCVVFDETAGFFPVKPGMQTFSMDGAWVCRKPLGTPQPAGFNAGWHSLPIFDGHVYYADHAVHMSLNPIDVDTTEFLCQWFVHEDAVEGVDYDTASVIEIFDITNREDVALTEANARGARSIRFVPGPNSPTRESGLDEGLTHYLELMGDITP
ncbi:aromatic ring-hydroxylating oxygenase subunit alpha [Microbacterium gorillae]|uniref:aromatic ring-hydroxylating oxygenase subunit alpha n=1 Tax=Microbacterium gorillae TaxID=1231063 RepID=UPI00058CEA17|nr:aromatic ring-hydroxylating dioxygenase subunit alpha [Microbacterium gorillae]